MLIAALGFYLGCTLVGGICDVKAFPAELKGLREIVWAYYQTSLLPVEEVPKLSRIIAAHDEVARMSPRRLVASIVGELGGSFA